MKPERKDIERYVSLRFGHGNMMEKAVYGQPMQNVKTKHTKSEINNRIKFHELQIRRLKAIKIFDEWCANILKWAQPDYEKILRYRMAQERLTRLTM
jgi:hypothetical protein